MFKQQKENIYSETVELENDVLTAIVTWPFRRSEWQLGPVLYIVVECVAIRLQLCQKRDQLASPYSLYKSLSHHYPRINSCNSSHTVANRTLLMGVP